MTAPPSNGTMISRAQVGIYVSNASNGVPAGKILPLSLNAPVCLIQSFFISDFVLIKQ
jgi:hypothetical protein